MGTPAGYLVCSLHSVTSRIVTIPFKPQDLYGDVAYVCFRAYIFHSLNVHYWCWIVLPLSTQTDSCTQDSFTASCAGTTSVGNVFTEMATLLNPALRSGGCNRAAEHHSVSWTSGLDALSAHQTSGAGESMC